MQRPGMSSNAGPSTNLPSHPPISTFIPISAVQSLIPRLTTTINDIDSLKAQIASGNGDSSLPSWDTLLQRYSLLLGRINSITSFLSPSPSTGTSNGITKSTNTAGSELGRYLVHPLNALPLTSSSDPSEEISPLAPETFFQVINTSPNPLTLSKTNNKDTASNLEWHSSEELRKMSESSLLTLERNLKSRLEKDSLRANVLKGEVERQSEEYDWKLRIDENADDDDEEEEEVKEDKQREEEEVENEDEDDLFGGDDDDVVMLDSTTQSQPPPAATETTQPVPLDPHSQSKNSKANWTINDYVRYMDTGDEPSPSASA